MGNLTRIDHVGFTVADLDRSVAWYRRFLDAEPLAVTKGWDAPYSAEMIGYPGCVIDWAYFPLPGGGRLELVQYVQPPPAQVDMETWNTGNGHLCVVVDDIHAEFERLRDVATVQSPAPVQIPVGPNAGGWGGYVRDPDGITIQLLQPPSTTGGQQS
jgi:catechol 2,3-dioxygenase-like lactoylglutathione lyase family enzyme